MLVAFLVLLSSTVAAESRASLSDALSSDAVSAVQGVVHAHTSGRAVDRCSSLEPEEEGEEPLPDGIAKDAEIVVVRGGGEDVRWLDAVPEVPALVYNRNGLPEQLPKQRGNLRVVKQENVGHEDDAILRHIVDNYDGLPQHTVFLQGWPFWHCAGALDMVRRGIRNAAEPTDPDFIGTGALPGLAPMASSFYRYNLQQGALGNWVTLTLGARNKSHQSEADAKAQAVRSFNDTCRTILGGPCPNEHWVSEGSQWVVSRDRIRQRPLSFYQQLLSMTLEGDEIHRTRLRGLVLEALWPALWGAAGWAPGRQAGRASGGALNADGKVDAMGGYCAFGTDRLAFAAAAERRSLCELERRASGAGSKALLSAGGTFEPVVELRAVHGHKISKEAMLAGSNLPQAGRPKRTHTDLDGLPMCLKRHIWPVAMSTHLRNRKTGKCVERGQGYWAMRDCDEQLGAQMMRVSANGNGGYYQILDTAESSCFSHAFGEAKAEQCRNGPDGGAMEHQKWELVPRGNGTYQIKQKDVMLCVVHDGGLRRGNCKTAAADWELTDAVNMGQYWKRFDYALTELADGRVALRCVMSLQSYDDHASLDLVEPEWRRRGRLLSFRLEEPPVGAYPPNSYFFKQRGDARSPGGVRYLGCDRETKGAAIGSAKVAWTVVPVSDGFVYLRSPAGVLQFSVAGGVLRCSAVEDGAPPNDATFAIEFPAVSVSRVL